VLRLSVNYYPLTKKGPEFALDDFVPVCNLSAAPYVMCVKEDGPYKTLHDFIQAAKTKKMKYSTPGVASAPHIFMEGLAKLAGFQAIHVPYAGGSPAMVAALGGHVDIAVTGGVAGMIGPGRLRVIGVTTENRFELYPDVPTLKESGYPIVCAADYFIWAPKGTPNEHIKKISDAFKKVAEENTAEVKKILNTADHSLAFKGPDELGKYTYAEYDRTKKMLEELGITPK
jgi:tripartite-type tricarboxylate transporter receptor subunit TctC